jgi:hypothetical protein
MPIRKIIAGLFVAAAGVPLLIAPGWVGYRTWPRPLPQRETTTFPEVVFHGDRMALRATPGPLLAKAATFHQEVTAYLNYEYLRTTPQAKGRELFLVKKSDPKGSAFHLYILLDNDLLQDLPYLGNLAGSRLIPGFQLQGRTTKEIAAWRTETQRREAAYRGPVRRPLESLDTGQLLPQLVCFLKFKSETDPRVLAGIQPVFLSDHQARILAEDIITVGRFYHLPLDFFLGIAAMENNYMNVSGDLGHAVWKRRAQQGDIVLKRRRRRVLVLNYSIGVWQITRETLRYAHRLYEKDSRDYSNLPERLRPPQRLDLDKVSPPVLTTYAGLLFRDLLDKFHGNARLAVAAYNGGKRTPNLEYADGVARVAAYARRILEHAVPVNQQEIGSEAENSPPLMLPVLASEEPLTLIPPRDSERLEK